jgi:hypothetical protein
VISIDQPVVSPYVTLSGVSVASYTVCESGMLIGDCIWPLPHSGTAAKLAAPTVLTTFQFWPPDT